MLSRPEKVRASLFERMIVFLIVCTMSGLVVAGIVRVLLSAVHRVAY